MHVLGHWELSWSAPLTEATLWALPLRDFGLTDWHMWPVSGIRCPEPSVTLHEHSDFGEALDALPEGPRVFFEADNPLQPPKIPIVDLDGFEHPDVAAWVFGSAHSNPAMTAPRSGVDHVVTVPTLGNSGALWPHQVLVAAAYDRLVKSWR